MSFNILINNPIIQQTINKDQPYTISMFLKKGFSSTTEFPILIFNGILIDLTLKETICANIYKILDTLSLIQSANESEAFLHWSGGAFNSMWTLSWTDEKISIQTEWGEIYPQQLSNILEENPSIEMNKSEFLNEWKILLSFILRKIEEANIKIDDSYFYLLKDVEGRIPLFGKYYSHLN